MPCKPVDLDEYLHTPYEYDREWVGGVVIERNGGEFPHSHALALLCAQLFRHDRDYTSLISVRVRTSARTIRVPDLVTLKPGSPREPIITHPPLLVIEVKAGEDTLAFFEDKSAEYRQFGIEHVWIIDPYARVAYRGTGNGLELVRTGELVIPGTPIRIVPDELFAELDHA